MDEGRGHVILFHMSEEQLTGVSETIVWRTSFYRYIALVLARTHGHSNSTIAKRERLQGLPVCRLRLGDSAGGKMVAV